MNVILEIMVDGEGFADVKFFELEETAPLAALVAMVARSTEEAALLSVFVEGEEEPCDLGQPVREHHRHHVHHIHRHKRIAVFVDYGGETIEHSFPPATTVQRVLDWAVGSKGFSIEPTFAAEMQLALAGTETELAGTAHIGRYVHGHEHKLELTLLRGVIFNG